MTDTRSLGSRASRGASTTLLWQIVRVGTQIGGTVLLARLLSPADFGLIAMVTSLVGIGEILRDFGLTSAAVQAKSLSNKQKNNLFWINATVGALMTALVLACAPLVARLYDRELLEPLAQALSATFLLNGLAAQFRAELNRRMRFVALNVVDTLPAVLGLAVASALALATGSVWALVAQQLCTAACGLFLAVALVGSLPGRPARHAEMAGLLRFGGGVAGTQSVAYVTRNADNVAIGLVWGAGALGIYSRAYQLLMAPIVQLLAPMTRVALPVLSRLQDDSDRFVSYLRRGQLVGSLVAGTIYGLVFGLASPVTALLFGEGWSGLAPVFQALAVGGVFRALNQVAYWAYLGRGLAGHQFRFYLVSQPVIVLFLFAGLPWGPFGVAVGHSLAYALNWFAALWWCGRVTGISFGGLIRDGMRTTITFSVPVAMIGYFLAPLVENPIGAIGTVLVAASAWFVLVFLVLPSARTDIRSMLDVLARARRTDRKGKQESLD
ncbi:lipopolysaccharide biosynthesis protein [Modestobacter sp. SYSU DS0511]